MKKQRKHYTPEEKVAILRRHLVEGVLISDLCDERGLQPTVFYRWQKEFFENGAAAFQQKGRTNHQLDADIAAVSPASVWRVLSRAGLMRKWSGKPSKKGTGFEQPPQPHQHWHIDVSYINVSGTFYYLCSVLDGYSRFIVHWDLRESM